MKKVEKGATVTGKKVTFTMTGPTQASVLRAMKNTINKAFAKGTYRKVQGIKTGVGTRITNRENVQPVSFTVTFTLKK